MNLDDIRRKHDFKAGYTRGDLIRDVREVEKLVEQHYPDNTLHCWGRIKGYLEIDESNGLPEDRIP